MRLAQTALTVLSSRTPWLCGCSHPCPGHSDLTAPAGAHAAPRSRHPLRSLDESLHDVPPWQPQRLPALGSGLLTSSLP